MMLRRLPKRALSLASHPQQNNHSPFPFPLSPPHLDTFPLRISPHHRPALNSTGNRGRGRGGDTELSDQEWEMRTGRAIYILRQTYPNFFNTGLVSSLPSAYPDTAAADTDVTQGSIYSPKIRLSYTPPLALSLPKPLQTLHIEGLPLYNASAVFVRTTMKTLYTDLSVELKRITVNSSSSSSGHPSPSSSQDGGSTAGEETTDQKQAQCTPPEPRHRREKSVFIALTVTGIARVSGSLGVWDVASTYTFSPHTALITHHTVNSIHPAPHQAVYEALRGVLFGRSHVGRGAYDVGAGVPVSVPVRSGVAIGIGRRLDGDVRC